MSVPMIPIDPENRTDTYYRYKMPAIQIKVEGSGNGIKTVFPNIHDVCLAINRPEGVLMKFFQSEMGAQSTVLEKDDKFLIMGNHAEDRVQEKVYDFIRKFVLCRGCRNPETKLSVERKKGVPSVSMSCGACGKVLKLTDLDKRYVTFISMYYAKFPQQALKKGASTAETSADKDKRVTTDMTTTSGSVSTEKAVIEESDIKDTREPPQLLLAQCMKQYPNDKEEILKCCMELMSSYNLPEEWGPLLVLDAIFAAEKEFIAGLRRHSFLLKRISTPSTIDLLDDTTDETRKTDYLERVELLKFYTIDECVRLCVKSDKPEKIVVVLFVLFIDGILSRSVIEKWYGKEKCILKVNAELYKLARETARPLVEWFGQ